MANGENIVGEVAAAVVVCAVGEGDDVGCVTRVSARRFFKSSTADVVGRFEWVALLLLLFFEMFVALPLLLLLLLLFKLSLLFESLLLFDLFELLVALLLVELLLLLVVAVRLVTVDIVADAIGESLAEPPLAFGAFGTVLGCGIE